MDNNRLKELEEIEQKYKSRNKYINDFQKSKYDRVVVLLNKGQKDVVETKAKEKGYKSITEYIKALINQDLNTGATSGGCDLAENFNFSEEPDSLPFS